MTTGASLLIGASSADLGWDAIDWQTAERSVRRLQMRIAKAVTEKKWNKVKSLQWILAHSFSAKFNRRSSVKRRLIRGLSRMMGNYLVRFLGGNGSVSSPLYPDYSFEINLFKSAQISSMLAYRSSGSL